MRASAGLAPFLAQTLDNPYDVVRYISARSLRRLPGYNDFAYDFVAKPPQRARARQRALEAWRAQSDRQAGRTGSEVLIDPDGSLRQNDIARLLSQRDDHPMELGE